jgi:hypothetical protein
MKSWFLKCRLSQGMLPGEFAVVTSTSDGREISLFAPARFVRQQGPEGGLVEVRLIEQKAGRALVSLPAEPMETPSRTVTVPASQLVTG